MRLHIFDSTGDTIVAVTDDTITEAEEIIQRHWDKGSSIFTKEGERIGTGDPKNRAADLASFRAVTARAEDAYVVPRLAGG